MSYKIDLENIVNGLHDANNFSSQLMRIVFTADRINIVKLGREYPNLVKTVVNYRNSGEILDLPDD